MAYPAQLWELYAHHAIVLEVSTMICIARAGAAIWSAVQPVKAQGVISAAEWLQQFRWAIKLTTRTFLSRIYGAQC